MPKDGLHTIGETSAIVGIPASTIRFYDKNGLLPHVRRDENGLRQFSDKDIDWLRFLEKLKISGMPIREMRSYVELASQGDETIEERRHIVHDRRNDIRRRIEELERSLDIIEYKCWFYDKACELGSERAARGLSDDDIPERIKKLKRRCQINE